MCSTGEEKRTQQHEDVSSFVPECTMHWREEILEKVSYQPRLRISNRIGVLEILAATYDSVRVIYCMPVSW
jgi:hypothetical protein